MHAKPLCAAGLTGCPLENQGSTSIFSSAFLPEKDPGNSIGQSFPSAPILIKMHPEPLRDPLKCRRVFISHRVPQIRESFPT